MCRLKYPAYGGCKHRDAEATPLADNILRCSGVRKHEPPCEGKELGWKAECKDENEDEYCPQCELVVEDFNTVWEIQRSVFQMESYDHPAVRFYESRRLAEFRRAREYAERGGPYNNFLSELEKRLNRLMDEINGAGWMERVNEGFSSSFSRGTSSTHGGSSKSTSSSKHGNAKGLSSSKHRKSLC